MKYNIIPLPYRGVSVQNYDGPMSQEGLIGHFMGRETYRRTEFIVLRAKSDQFAVIAVDALDREPLFSPITYVEVLALPGSCVYVRDPQTDCGNRSSLAALHASRRGGAGNAYLRRKIRSRQFHLSSSLLAQGHRGVSRLNRQSFSISFRASSTMLTFPHYPSS